MRPTAKQLDLLRRLEGNAKPPTTFSEAAWRIERLIGR